MLNEKIKNEMTKKQLESKLEQNTAQAKQHDEIVNKLK